MFRFLRPGRLVDGELELVLVSLGVMVKQGYGPSYQFEMRRTGTPRVLGTIRLRVDTATKLRYAGHIGFGVNKRYRGHRYAARSCALLLPFARAHGLRAVWLTCDPKNVASQKSCLIAGARYVATIRVPENHDLYRRGTKYVRRYRIAL
jgi:tagatose 1,6-diphosphate aldolase